MIQRKAQRAETSILLEQPEDVVMLAALQLTQARRVARLANAARGARDSTLNGVAADVVDEPHPAKGEQDRLGPGSFDLLSVAVPSVAALRAEIENLSPAAQSELFALMRIGQGELAPKEWERGLSEAATLGEETVRGVLADDIDLQAHLDKGLYELTHISP